MLGATASGLRKPEQAEAADSITLDAQQFLAPVTVAMGGTSSWPRRCCASGVMGRGVERRATGRSRTSGSRWAGGNEPDPSIVGCAQLRKWEQQNIEAALEWKARINKWEMMPTPQDILKASIIQLITLWRELLSDDYLLHIKNARRISDGESVFHTDHYLFGDVDWSRYDEKRWHKQNSFHAKASLVDVESLIEQKLLFALEDAGNESLDIIFLSTDLVYAFHFSAVNGTPEISMDLSSAIFGKCTHHRYVTATHHDGSWMLASRFERAKVYRGFNGSFLQCVQFVLEQENTMVHPYQKMIDLHPKVYRDATKHKRQFI